ncbi:hypothetical protein FOCC_FOCC000163 [Frankliniella occidentalis]|nr:hypothetical protein FOCC_FOCC000163 [Frankliniella occidentalis]
MAPRHWASLAVKNVSMSIPDAVAQGSTVTLRCDYDLEGQPLYSIKWFRGESEFYQYVPKEIPASKVFDVDGVKIKVDVTADALWSPGPAGPGTGPGRTEPLGGGEARLEQERSLPAEWRTPRDGELSKGVDGASVPGHNSLREMTPNLKGLVMKSVILAHLLLSTYDGMSQQLQHIIHFVSCGSESRNMLVQSTQKFKLDAIVSFKMKLSCAFFNFKEYRHLLQCGQVEKFIAQL